MKNKRKSFFVLKVKSEWKIPTKPFQSRLSFIYSFIDVTSEVKPRVFQHLRDKTVLRSLNSFTAERMSVLRLPGDSVL
jgi:hypothetical protein